MKQRKIKRFLFVLATFLLLQAAGPALSATSIMPGGDSEKKSNPEVVSQQNDEKTYASKQAADSAYIAKAYDKAITIYESLLEKGVDADVFYNLGNTYYRKNDLPRAILNYEKALKYEPRHKDAHHNLEICRTKLGITQNPPTEMFFITWFNHVTAFFSADQWGALSLLSFSLAAFLIALRRMTHQHILKKTVSYILPFAAFAFALTTTCACLQHHRFHNNTYAVALKDTTIEDENGKAGKNILRAGTTVLQLKKGSAGKIMVQTSDKTCKGWADSRHFMPV